MTLSLAASITRSSSRQTYATIRLLADRERVEAACQAYAYFRWVDDRLDAPEASIPECAVFLQRQQALLAACYSGSSAGQVLPQEQMLIDLVRQDADRDSGLHAYLTNMMAVLAFDAERRGRTISQVELEKYSDWLAISVTEAMHYFFGHDSYSPKDETRNLAVFAAHVAHMLRDAVQDAAAGYYNIPSEVLEAGGITALDLDSPPYRDWVRSRVQLAREKFEAGREYLRRVGSWRCRLAGFAYAERFERLLDIIVQDDYLLRPAYDEHPGWQMLQAALISSLGWE